MNSEHLQFKIAKKVFTFFYRLIHVDFSFCVSEIKSARSLSVRSPLQLNHRPRRPAAQAEALSLWNICTEFD